MSWLNPSLLWLALLALAPLLLHFLLRERVRKVAFSAVRFLRRQSREVLARHRWLERLLTALRVACVLLLVVGFGRPFFAEGAGAGGTTQRELILMLDVSRSMLYATRFPEAQEDAAKLIESAEPGTAVTVVTFADESSVAVHEAQGRGAALELVKRAKPAGGSTDVLGALDKVLKRLAERNGRGDVHLISDLQASGISRGRDIPRLPAGYRCHVHAVGAKTPASNEGIAVEGGAFSSDITPKDNNLDVSARIFNRGKAREVEARLECDGKALATKKVSLPQNGEAVVALTGTLRELGEHAGQVEVAGAPVTLSDDDHFHFIARVVNKVRVVVLRPLSPTPSRSGEGSGGGQSESSPDAAFYLVRALNAGADSPFQAEIHEKLPTLDGVDAVILAHLSGLPAADVGRLAEFLRAGGGLFAGLGEKVDATAFNGGLGRLLPARLRAWHAAEEDNSLVVSDAKHPLVTHLVGEGGDLTTAQFHGSWDLKDSQGSRVILRFNDNRPALLESRLGKGIVLFLAAGLDTRSGDFPLRAIFVPFFQESVRLLLARSEQQNALAAGETIVVPAGGSIVLPDGSEQRATGGESLSLPATQPGIYRVKSGGKTELYATNASPSESDLTMADPQELEKLLDSSAASEVRKTASGYERVLLPGDKLAAEQRHRIGWWCLCALAILLALELWLAGAASRR